MIEEEREREWLRELEESVVNINDGVNELIELQNSLTSECHAIEVFAEHIVGDSNIDLTLLLDILNPSNVVSADMWSNFGLRISGRRREFRTCVEVNIPLFCSSPLDIENDCFLNAVFAARATTTRIDREVVNDAGTEFTLVSPASFPLASRKLTPYQLKYINDANKEIEKLRTTQEELKKALQIQRESIVAKSALALKWQQHKAQSRNTKRKAKETTGKFIDGRQKKLATKAVLERLDIVADTPSKQQVLSDAVVQHCTQQSPATVKAKCAIADCAAATVKLLNTIDAEGETANELKRLRSSLVRVLVPSPQDVAHLGKAKTTQTEVATILGLNSRNREFRGAAAWRTGLNERLRTSSPDVAEHLIQKRRKRRSDALTSDDIALIEQAWRECSEQSPNAKDTVRCRESDGSYTIHALFKCYCRTEDVLEHTKNVHHKTFSLTTVHNYKPYYIRNGTADTCLCHYCENIRLMKVAVLQNTDKIGTSLQYVRAYHTLKLFLRNYRFVKFLRLVPDFAHINGRVLFYTSSCLWQRICRFDTRYPMETIVSACRGAYKAQILDRVLCTGALPSWNQMSVKDCGRCKCYGECIVADQCGFCTGGSLKRLLSQHTVSLEIDAFNLRSIQQYMGLEPAIDSATMKYKTWGSDDSGTSSGELVVVEGTTEEFAQYTQQRLIQYAYHIATLRRQKHVARRTEMNLLPHMIAGSMDFSENMKLNVARNETQSAHWRTEGATLFICVMQHLCLDTWNDKVSSIRAGAAVSIETTGGIVPGVVMKEYDRDSTDNTLQVGLTESGNRSVLVSRTSVHVRTLITTPIVVVSDDKHHDTYFVQHFMHVHIHGPNGWFAQQSAEFRSTHTEFHWASDGAASHFKQANTILSTHQLREENNIDRLTWTFGCPGHGKGVWDGLGGTIKHTCTRHMKKMDLTIKTASEFFNLVVELFDSEEARCRYGRRKDIQCNKWYIYYTNAADTDKLRPASSDSYETKIDSIVGFPQSIGSRRVFYYEPLGVSKTVNDVIYRQMAMRINGCFCSACSSTVGSSGDTQSKNRRPRQPLLPTLDPFIKDCILGESWDYQQMRQKRVPRLSNSDLEAHTDAVPIDSVAEAVVADTTTDHLCWAQCDSCGKWRTTKRLLEEDEQFVCNDTSITRNLQFAQCDAPEEPWA